LVIASCFRPVFLLKGDDALEIVASANPGLASRAFLMASLADTLSPFLIDFLLLQAKNPRWKSRRGGLTNKQ